MDTPTTREDYIALAVAGGLAGVGLIALGLRGSTGGGVNPPCAPLSGETLGPPVVTGLPSGQISVSISQLQTFTIPGPSVLYSGSGRNAYTYAQVKQGQVSVMGSGVAGIRLGPATSPTSFPLVPATAPDNGVLIVYQWSNPPPNVVPICGAPPHLGSGDLYIQLLECYQGWHASDGSVCDVGSNNPADTDGFSSPTCNPSRCVMPGFLVLPGKILFVP